MGMRAYSTFSIPSILGYYNLLGLDLNYINAEDINAEVRCISELRPDIAYKVLPKSSMEVAKEFELFLEEICCSFAYSEEGLTLKTMYYNSVIGILNAITSLNLIPEESEDYLLNFERVNSILKPVLAEINSSSIEDVIEFAKCLGKGEIIKLLHETNTFKFTALLAVLALNPNRDIPDYEMFSNDKSSQFDVKKLLDLVEKNVCSKYEKYALNLVFKRPSYLTCSLASKDI